MSLDLSHAGCPACRYFWAAGGRPAPLCIVRAQHAALYRCGVCGTYWREEERYAVPTDAADVQASCPDVRVEALA